MLWLSNENRWPLMSYVAASLSGILLYLAWPPIGLTPLAFVAFVPLLYLVETQNLRVKYSGIRLFSRILLCMFVWNLLTTWWVWNASPGGAVFAIVANALLMCIPFALYIFLRKGMSFKLSFFGFLVFWLAFESVHETWDLAWPWLNLGNLFAGAPDLVQWYEYTGIAGGSLWIWLSNMGLTQILISIENKELTKIRSKAIGWISLIIIPILISLVIKPSTDKFKNKEKGIQVTLLQPNIDPYKEKFDRNKYDENLLRMINMSLEASSDSIDLIIWPETAIQHSFNEDDFFNNEVFGKLNNMLGRTEGASLLTGVSSHRVYDSARTITARKRRENFYIDFYNTAWFLNDNTSEFYHKSKLVPGVEIMPYPAVFKLLEPLAINLGGIGGSLGRQDSATVFKSKDIKVAPLICYESVFGNFVTRFLDKDANLIAIITNDAWWGNTPGYKQHFSYARLRAIENRKYVVRSANTGISGIIDPAGNILNKTQYWEEAVINSTVYLNSHKTFFSSFGNYLGRTSYYLSVYVLLVGIMRSKILKSNYFL